MNVSRELQTRLDERRDLWRQVGAIRTQIDTLQDRIDELLRQETDEVLKRLEHFNNKGLAAAVGVTAPTVGHWRARRFKINSDHLAKLRTLAGMPQPEVHP